MNMKDGDVTRWSPNSCDGSDMEECEARLYSMVYHTSNSYDDAPVDAQSSNINVTSGEDNLNPNHDSQPESSAGCSIIEVDDKERSNGDKKEFHHSLKNKASRLNAVNEIITNADTNKSKDLVIETNKQTTSTFRKDKNKSPKKQVRTEAPKTASLYFQNLTKSLNNVQYLQSVQPRPKMPSNSRGKGGPISRFCPPFKNPTANMSQSHNSSALTNFTFTDACRHGDTSGTTPVFRLDDRLFPNVSRNTSKEEFELSNRLFSNKQADSNLFVDRNRHNHLFNQLPTIPITSTVLSKKEKRQQKIAKRKEKKLQWKRRNKSSKSSSPEEIEQPQVVVDVSVPAILNRLTTVSLQVQEQLVIQAADDSPVAVFDKRDILKVDVDEVIDVDLTSTEEIINLDSDTDSVDSIVILTPPVRSPPPVIALEASDDETPTDKVETIHPLLDAEHIENSFDFLDSSDETEGLVRSQAFLFSTLISSSGSKESLLDDRFFKTHDESDLEKNSGMKPSTSTRHVRGVSNSPVHKVAITELQIKNVKQNSCEGAQTNLPVVNLDESFHSVESITTVSEQTVGITSNSLNEDIQVVHSGNLINNMLVDLEIDNLLGETSNAQVVDSVLKVGEPIVKDVCITITRKKKRLELQERRTEKNEGSRLSRLERQKKSKERKLQMQNAAQQRSGMAPIVYTKILGDELIPMNEVRSRNPAHWTKEMRRFYNKSWGGENFDVADVQQTMSKDPSLWRVSWEDKRGPVNHKGPYRRSRCFNCFRFGHPAYHCPEPVRPPKCYMCGNIGHKEANCTQRICLQCGRPSSKYRNGCWDCQQNPFDLCLRCIWKHDPAKTCFDLRHKPVDISTVNLESQSAGNNNKRRSDNGPSTDTLAAVGQSAYAETDDLRTQLEQRRMQSVGPSGKANRHSDGNTKKRNWEESVGRTSGCDQQYKRQRSYHDNHREKAGSSYYKKQSYRESR